MKKEAQSPCPVIQISSHPMWRNRQMVRREKLAKSGAQSPAATLTPSPQVPEESVAILFRKIGDCLLDLQREGCEQRAILQTLIKCIMNLQIATERLLKQCT